MKPELRYHQGVDAGWADVVAVVNRQKKPENNEMKQKVDRNTQTRDSWESH